MSDLAALDAAGGLLSAVCCVTPLLPWLFPALGIGGAPACFQRDAVLLPLLAGVPFLTGYALWRRARPK